MRSRIDGDERNVVFVGAAAAIAVVIVIVIVVAILEWPRRAGEWKKEMGGGMAMELQLREEGVVTMTMIVIMTMTTVAMLAVLVLVLVLVLMLMAEENDVVGGVSTAASSRCRGYEAHDGCRILRSE